MKKFALTATMGVLMFVGLSAMVSMGPPVNTSCQAQCSALSGVGISFANGNCMSACNTCLNPGQPMAVCMCRVLGDMEVASGNSGFNFGQCVSAMKKN